MHGSAQLAKTTGTVEQATLTPGCLRATPAEFSEFDKSRPRQLNRSAVGAAVSRPDAPPSEIGLGEVVARWGVRRCVPSERGRRSKGAGKADGGRE